MHEEQHTSILFGSPSVIPLTACRAALLAQWGSGPILLRGQTRGRLDQASTKRLHASRPVSCFVLARWWGDLGGAGSPGEERVSEEAERSRGGKGEGGDMVTIQCLSGPLLWVTESEISRNAERITLKDLSQRDVTSSDVIPFVSIFGRIFNLIVPEDGRE